MSTIAAGIAAKAEDLSFDKLKNELKNRTEAKEGIENPKAEEVDKDKQQAGASGDTVSISEQAREKAKSAPGLDGKKLSGGGEPEGEDPASEIKRQIKAVKEKLEDAKARLAKAQDNSSSESSEEPQIGGETEAKAIQEEIKALSQQLMLLNEQLAKIAGNGSGAGGDGVGSRAGIGGESKGPSGQGQRIPATA